MFDIAIIVLTGLFCKWFFGKLCLPGILGFVTAGLLLGPSGLDIIKGEILCALQEFKTIALIIILLRIGLGIDQQTLKRIGGTAVKIGFIPCVLEGASITLLAWKIFGFQLYEAGMLAFIIAAVSPAIIVPAMFKLKEHGYGQKKEVPTTVLAGASIDDLVAITLFGVFAGIGSSSEISWSRIILGVPTGIIVGVLFGGLIGYILVSVLNKYNINSTHKTIIITFVAVFFYYFVGLDYIHRIFPIAALLVIVAIGFIYQKYQTNDAADIAKNYSKLWVLAEILLFASIGADIQINAITYSSLVMGVSIICLGLIFRSIGVIFSTINSELVIRERIFCILAYWPKATVQATLGAVPLSLVLSGTLPGTSIETAQNILSIAVMSIIITAPLGAISIKLFAKQLLTNDSTHKKIPTEIIKTAKIDN